MAESARSVGALLPSTVMVKVFVRLSTPPLSVPPLSCATTSMSALPLGPPAAGL